MSESDSPFDYVDATDALIAHIDEELGNTPKKLDVWSPKAMSEQVRDALDAEEIHVDQYSDPIRLPDGAPLRNGDFW